MFAFKLGIDFGLMLISIMIVRSRLVVVFIEGIIFMVLRLIMAEPFHHSSRRYCIEISLQQEYWAIFLPFAGDV